MKKIFIALTIVLLPPLGALLAIKSINKRDQKLVIAKEQLKHSESEIEVLLETKNEPWTKQQIAKYKKLRNR